MKSKQWIKDRNALRNIIRDTKVSGKYATLLYCLVSHMRGKLHMNYYEKYHGGFPVTDGTERDTREVNRLDIPLEVRKAYTGCEIEYYTRCHLGSLDDQKSWIEWYIENSGKSSRFRYNLGFAEIPENVKEIIHRTLSGSKEEIAEDVEELQQTG